MTRDAFFRQRTDVIGATQSALSGGVQAGGLKGWGGTVLAEAPRVSIALFQQICALPANSST